MSEPVIRYAIEVSADEVVPASLSGKRYSTEQEAKDAMVKAGVFGRVVRERIWCLS